LNSLQRTKTEILGFKAPTKTQSKLTHSYEQPDLSNLTDEELDNLERLVNKAAYPPGGGQLYGLGENGLGKPYEGVGDTG